MLAPVGGNARVEDVVVAALDDVDGVDLHVAEMLDRRARRLRPVAERRRRVEPLGVEPDALAWALVSGWGLLELRGIARGLYVGGYAFAMSVWQPT